MGVLGRGSAAETSSHDALWMVSHIGVEFFHLLFCRRFSSRRCDRRRYCGSDLEQLSVPLLSYQIISPDEVKMTFFERAVVPPPMHSVSCKLETCVNDVVISSVDETCVVLLGSRRSLALLKARSTVPIIL